MIFLSVPLPMILISLLQLLLVLLMVVVVLLMMVVVLPPFCPWRSGTSKRPETRWAIVLLPCRRGCLGGPRRGQAAAPPASSRAGLTLAGL